MSNPKRNSEQYQPDHLGTQPRKANANKSEQMGMKQSNTPRQVDQKGDGQ